MKLIMGKLKRVYKGIIFDISQREITFPAGNKKIFEYCRRPNSVSILAFDKKGRLLLIKEFRHGYDRNVWFLPAGRVGRTENPAKAAQRELREEGGFAAKKMKLVHEKSPSHNLFWKIYIFAARDLYPAPLKGDEDFPIQVKFVPLGKAVKMAMDGTIENEFIAYNIIRFQQMLKSGQFKW